MKCLLKNVLHYNPTSLLFVITIFFLSTPLYASERIEGCFIATETCEAFRSIKKKSNPDNLKLIINSRYKVHAKNKPSPSHYQITIPNNNTPLRWVSTSCGRYLRHCQQEAEGCNPSPAIIKNQ